MGFDTLTTVETRHEDMIHDAQLDFYGRRLATASSDRTVRIFEVAGDQHTEIAALRGHEGPVWQSAWAHPKFGSLIASCSYDGRVIIWKEQSGQQQQAQHSQQYATNNGGWEKYHEHAGHSSSVNAVAWAPHELDCLMLACASSDGSVSILTAKEDGLFESTSFHAHSIGCNAVSWAPAFAPGTLAQPQQQGSAESAPVPVRRIVTAGSDNAVKIWHCTNETSWELEATLPGHLDWVRDVAWAPNVGIGGSMIASGGQDSQVLIFKQSSPSDPWTSTVLNKFPDVVWRVSWSVTGNILAVSGGDNKVTLWKETVEGDWGCLSALDQN